jgi:hypothetical protein
MRSRNKKDLAISEIIEYENEGNTCLFPDFHSFCIHRGRSGADQPFDKDKGQG